MLRKATLVQRLSHLKTARRKLIFTGHKRVDCFFTKGLSNTTFFRLLNRYTKKIFKMNKKSSKELEDFLDNINPDTPEKIILQTHNAILKDPIQVLTTNVKLRGILEGTTLARVSSFEKCLMMIFLRFRHKNPSSKKLF